MTSARAPKKTQTLEGHQVYDYKLGRVIVASSAGTTIEWYDFYIFASLFALLSEKFFPPGNDACGSSGSLR